MSATIGKASWPLFLSLLLSSFHEKDARLHIVASVWGD